MPRKILPRIAAVTSGNQPMTLRIRWDKGEEGLIDVSGMIQSFRVYAPLRQSPELFRQVRVGEHGTDVVWSDEIDMAADTLWRLAQEQAGETMSPDAFRHWRERKGYTLDEAARALGLSRRMVAYYEKGDRPIPRVVALATRALDMASATEERFFYHNFPRRGRDTATEIDKGCKILSLIRDMGLLLAPEVVEWDYPHTNGSPPRVERVLQRRVCFTELTPTELPCHAAEFGHFALEFRIDTLRGLGAIPVFYIPKPYIAQPDTLESLGSVLVMQLWDARNLANHIAQLSAAVAPSHVQETRFTIRYAENPSSERRFILSAPETRNALQAVMHGVTPASMLAAGIEGALSFFYPADDVLRNKALHYYRQREWRITGNIALRGQNIMNSPTADEAQKIQEVDADFFARKLKRPYENKTLLDECLIFPGLGDKRLIDLINRIIVPDDAIDKTKTILKNLEHYLPIVSLDELRTT